jgi:hypothetical protein
VADLLELSRLCNDLPDQIEAAACELVRGTVRAIDHYLVEVTPVDTTEAVSNWQPGINSPPSVALPAIVFGSRGSTAPQSRREAIAHVDRALAEKRPGEAFYLSNLAEHIVDLNNGTSQQEPAGFVERGIRIGEIYAAQAELEVAR